MDDDDFGDFDESGIDNSTLVGSDPLGVDPTVDTSLTNPTLDLPPDDTVDLNNLNEPEQPGAGASDSGSNPSSGSTTGTVAGIAALGAGIVSIFQKLAGGGSASSSGQATAPVPGGAPIVGGATASVIPGISNEVLLGVGCGVGALVLMMIVTRRHS